MDQWPKIAGLPFIDQIDIIDVYIECVDDDGKWTGLQQVKQGRVNTIELYFHQKVEEGLFCENSLKTENEGNLTERTPAYT